MISPKYKQGEIMKKQNWYVNPKKYHFIYKTTCMVNGKYYYGMHSTDDLNDGYVGSGTRLWHSIKKHGRENFSIEILEFCVDRESLKQREAELITEEMLQDPMCMNLAMGGGYQWPLSQTTQARLSRKEGLKEFWNSEQGDAAKRSISEKLKNREILDLTRQRASVSAKTRIKRVKESGEWEEIKKKNSIAHVGKTQSAEHVSKRIEAIKKRREKQGPRKFSNQARENISKSLIGSARNKKFWILIDFDGRETIIENLQRWLKDHECTAPTSTVVRDKNREVVYRLKRYE